MRESTLARWSLGYSWVVALLAVQLLDPFPQDPTYHDFADSGRWLGKHNFWNVVSNLAFVVAGAWGLRVLARRGGWAELLPEAAFFIGLILTGLGSGYYHWAPDLPGLAWDRLAMAVTFMALFTSLLGHCLDRRLARNLLPLALMAGAASVFHWVATEIADVGDLRYYAIVLFLPMLLIPWMLLRWPPRSLDRRWLWIMLLLYLAAKACELLDAPLASVLPLEFTGHALKHLLAAAAGWAFLRALGGAKSSAPPGASHP